MAENRVTRTEETFKKLFGGAPTGADHPDHEMMQILQRQIFGEVFHVGSLTDQMRELITLAVLTTLGCPAQVGAHTHAALNVGLSLVQIREAIYQCAPFIGYPMTLNALTAINETFKARDIETPLEDSATVTEEDRFEKGKELQAPLYDTHMRSTLTGLRDDIAGFMVDQLTANGFGDYYTRKGLTVAERELLVIVILAALGGMEAQLHAHLIGNVRAGNTKDDVLEALVQAYPYIGSPKAINALRIIKDVDVEARLK